MWLLGYKRGQGFTRDIERGDSWLAFIQGIEKAKGRRREQWGRLLLRGLVARRGDENE